MTKSKSDKPKKTKDSNELELSIGEKCWVDIDINEYPACIVSKPIKVNGEIKVNYVTRLCVKENDPHIWLGTATIDIKIGQDKDGYYYMLDQTEEHELIYERHPQRIRFEHLLIDAGLMKDNYSV